MANDGILAEDEALRRAVLWLGEADGFTAEAIEEAGRRFELSPQEQQFLIETLLPGGEDGL